MRIVAGANAATVLVMLLVGYSDRVNPVAHPLIANVGLLFPVFLLLNVAFLVFWLLFRKRGALISFVGFIVCYVPIRTYAPLNVPSDAPEGALKVLSYNVFNYSTWTDWSKPGEIVEYIVQHDADIVCLQEANCTGRKREIVDSVMALKYPYIKYESSKEKSGSDELALFSKLPILGVEHISEEGSTYNAVAYEVLTGKRDTTLVVVTHLQSTGVSLEDRSRFKSMLKGDMDKGETKQTTKRLWHQLGEASAIRAPQADAVAAFVERNRGKSIILAGDFNDSPISYVHHRIADELTDCYVSSANGPGISYYYSGFYVRIDNIMCSDHWKPYDCRVDKAIKASDHYPIMCWLERQQ